MTASGGVGVTDHHAAHLGPPRTNTGRLVLQLRGRRKAECRSAQTIPGFFAGDGQNLCVTGLPSAGVGHGPTLPTLATTAPTTRGRPSGGTERPVTADEGLFIPAG